MKMVQKTTIVEYPNVPSILALVGGALIVLVDVFLLAIAIVVLPHLNYANFTSPRGYTGSLGSLASGFVSAIAIFGLICGTIVLLSSVMLRCMPAQRQTWAILTLVFSILSFFGSWGVFVGAVLGITSGLLIVSWKPTPAL